MGLLSKFTKKEESKNKSKKEENVLDMVKEEKSQAKPQILKEDTGKAYHVLKTAHVSEKTSMLYALNRYVFKVNKEANKVEIAKAVEKTYDVHVVAVNIVNIKGKHRRMGRISGVTSDWKKAIVTLKTGEKISGLVEGV